MGQPLIERSERSMTRLLFAPHQRGGQLQSIRGPQPISFRKTFRHVAQSLAPLYLGRVASVIYETRGRPSDAVAKVTERLCQVFEEWKPYLVDRWR